jgi:hypothetical protein
MAEWISVLALVVSVSSLVYSIHVGRKNKILQAEQTRLDLLTKIVELKLAYRRARDDVVACIKHVNHLFPGPNTDLEALLNDIAEYTQETEKWYLKIHESTHKSGTVFFEGVRHHIIALGKHAEYQFGKIEKLKERLEHAAAKPKRKSNPTLQRTRRTTPRR